MLPMAARRNAGFLTNGLAAGEQILPMYAPMKAIRLVLTLFAIGLLALPAHAQAETDEVVTAEEVAMLSRNWTTRDGLPQDRIRAMIRTRDGFLWLGTDAGLARFDGFGFKTYGLHEGLG